MTLDIAHEPQYEELDSIKDNHQHYSIHNTFGVDARAYNYIEYKSVDELRAALHSAPRPFLHVGEGSNLLFVNDFPGTVFHCSNKAVQVVKESDTSVLVRVGAGMVWDDFVALCVERGWYGAENLSLIPGEVGASAVQNIGAYGTEVNSLIEYVETFDTEELETRIFSLSECSYGYRRSIFKRPEYKRYFVTSVVYRLSKVPHINISYGNLAMALRIDDGQSVDDIPLADVRRAIIEMRNSKLPDPSQIGSAGSFFINPVVEMEVYERLAVQYPNMPHYSAPDGKVKLSAGWMIEKCGWKGRNIGAAGVYSLQALVLVNLGGATGAEILELAQRIISDVEATFGISLTPEVQII